MLLFLQDLKGDQFAIEHKFDKLFVDNCPDFKTVPASVVELNIRNCASFESAPNTVQKLTIENCPRYLPNQRSNTMQDTDMLEALKNVSAQDDKETIFVEVLNLRAYVNRLLSRVKELESKE